MSSEIENEVTETSNSQDPKSKRTNRPQRSKGERKPSSPDAPKVDLEERVVAVNRVAKVVKGGRRFSFAALIVVGDKNGRVGYGLGKAKEVPDAIRKAGQLAAKKMVSVPIDNGTIPHEVIGKFGAGNIMFRPAAEGTGIKAAGACRSILELAGIKNVLTKSQRSTNPHNVIKATFEALKQLKSAKDVAFLRGADIKRIRLK
jgi:small subunit ribosomal protein S5